MAWHPRPRLNFSAVRQRRQHRSFVVDSPDSAALKQRLRTELRAWRASLGAREQRDAARQAADRFLRDPCLARADCVAVYLSVGAELDTQPLIDALWAAGRSAFAPRMRPGKRLDFVSFSATTPLRRNRWGFPEPAAHRPCARRRDLDVVLLPLLGFDAAGNRLGTGGGYYDRWLAGMGHRRSPLRVGYAYALQQVPHLPEEPWDQPLHAVVTERGVTWF